MTEVFGDFKVKRVRDDHGEVFWILFRNGLGEPLLVIPNYNAQQFANFILAATEQPKEGKQ